MQRAKQEPGAAFQAPRPPSVAVTALLLVVILITAAGLRLTGRDWDQGQHLHPDERFLTMVTLSLRPVDSLWEYFDSARSSLNPANVGSLPHYVYGTSPVIVLRLLAGATGQLSYAQVHLLGRVMSACCDLVVVLTVFCLGVVVGDRRVGLLAAAFSACAVLQIQVAHFFIVDGFANLLLTGALLLALLVASRLERGARWAVGFSLLFGLAAGAATAVKLSSGPVVLLLPLALAVSAVRLRADEPRRSVMFNLLTLTAAALVALATFRLMQPYAFSGPGLLGLQPDPRWVAGIRSLGTLVGPDADWPPAMQWSRRSLLFSAQNMILWGLGPPLGILGFAGLAWAGVRVVFKRELRLTVLWAWVAGYFAWQSLASNPTMRYQLPTYPGLCVLAAWAVIELRDRRHPVTARLVGGVVLFATAFWAVAFASVYTRPMTRVAASEWILSNLPGAVDLEVSSPSGNVREHLPLSAGRVLSPGQPYRCTYQATSPGWVTAVTLHRLTPVFAHSQATVTAVIVADDSHRQFAASSALPGDEASAGSIRLRIDPPVSLRVGSVISVEVVVDSGAYALDGTLVANESRWDDGLPLPVDDLARQPGVFGSDLTLELYDPEDPSKRDRISASLGRADLIAISSSRQWGSLPRIPERFPLVTAYYRELLGCPSEQSVVACYTVAQPGMYRGTLGFDLEEVFESRPALGPVRVNDQWAEEAFTVYDHPKVLLFRRSPSYRPERLREMLGAVDLGRVVQVAPGRAGRYPADLMLPASRLAVQRAGGTWSQLFDRDGVVNRWQAATVLLWYLTVGLLGAVTYPLLRRALPGLPDRGFAMARVAGLLLFAYLAWLAGSTGLRVTRTTLWGCGAAMLVTGFAVAVHDRRKLLAEWRERRAGFMLSEGLFLALFLVGVLLRGTSPGIWHSAEGGNGPVAFAQLNAVLKSSVFPPLDPGFAGGYLSSTYWGLVLVGMPMKWLGVVPAVGYDLALVTILALVGCGAFAVARNLVEASSAEASGVRASPLLAGVVAAVGTVVAAAPGVSIGSSGVLEGRLLAMPVILLVMAWAVSLLLRAGHWVSHPSRSELIATAAFGAVAMGSLRAIDLGSSMVAAAIGGASLAACAWRLGVGLRPGPRLAVVALTVTGVAGLGYLVFLPFTSWSGPTPIRLELWLGARTPLPTTLLRWGLPLVVLGAWLVREGRGGMTGWRSPARGGPPSLRFGVGAVAFGWAFVFASLLGWGVTAAWLLWPAIGLTGALLLCPGLDESRRAVLVLTGVALALILAAELVVVDGITGRLQTMVGASCRAWALLGVALGAVVAWQTAAVRHRGSRVGACAWLAALALFVGVEFVRPVVRAWPRVWREIISPQAPTLDLLARQPTASEACGARLDRTEDLRAARWLQDHVAGSPVIAEASVDGERASARFSTSTGLPAVIGWSWHEREQRAPAPAVWVDERLGHVGELYTTADPAVARALLDRYSIGYVVVGQLERACYKGPVGEALARLEGQGLRAVYQDGGTTIYEVTTGGTPANVSTAPPVS